LKWVNGIAERGYLIGNPNGRIGERWRDTLGLADMVNHEGCFITKRGIEGEEIATEYSHTRNLGCGGLGISIIKAMKWIVDQGECGSDKVRR
jgi:hypothetical protein